ncbi:tripartite tricarboxylate transporter TctB family protein [Manganibacter manganicus]|uniref:DUF1468 domain-containing protein n=1 Tax=Manganibacter manganicus TaxID=1873176 RepID=A0A1V8RLT5_9HYPH|nr:tripartite tricarboxylate transporter TctB family protein [Pseudaminobacter manganicus]OQM74157.1 hypothetical protein BFN67_22425 [Pseudaminobacter manganicus]
MLNSRICRAVFVGLTAIVALLFFWQSLSIPAPTFEPVGGARVPQATAIAIILLAVMALAMALSKRNAAQIEAEAIKPIDWRGVLFVIIFGAYAVALASRTIGLGWLTAAFLIATQALFSEKRFSPPLAIILAISAFALELIFTKVFIIDVTTSF